MFSLICDPIDRLNNEATENAPSAIKAHPFFKTTNFTGLRKQRAPFVPELKSITDTSHFPTEELDLEGAGKALTNVNLDEPVTAQKDLAFVGYTFKKFDQLTRRNMI
jgi:protein-serine/threonine kinase